jgi:beta-lactamase regulating signal transducer with metallopeptidase domain
MWHQLIDSPVWIGERLAAGSLQGAVVVGFAWAACRWIPRVPPALQAWVWWLVAAKLVLALLPMPALPVPLLPASDAGAAAPASAPVAATGSSHVTAPSIDPAPQARPADTARLDWLGVLAGAWLAGVLLHGLLLIRAALTTRRMVQRATPLTGIDLAPVSRIAATVGLERLPRVCSSLEVDAPQVVGFRDPVLLVPGDARGRFTDTEWRMALGHELLHICRRDVLLGWMPALAERLYFFHPLARLAAREYLMAREAACDAAVVRALDVPAADYGRLLVRLGVARSRSILVASSAAPSASCLKRRLEMLQHTASTTASRLMTAAVATAALLVLAPLELVAQRPPDPSPALPALPAPPSPPAAPAAGARALPPAAPVPPAPPAGPAQAAAPAPPAAPQAPAAPASPATPTAPAAPMAPAAPLPPLPPPPPSGDEVVLRLRVPASQQEAMDTALRVLETQLAQIEQRAANVQATTLSGAELDQIRRKLEEMMTAIRAQARAGETLQQRSADQLAQQMAEVNRQREALLRQQREVERQLAQMTETIERMKVELQAAQEAAKKR